MQNIRLLRLLLPLALSVLYFSPLCLAVKKDNCEYDMDLTRNVIKITCDGSASTVNVYADTAHVSGEDEVQEDEDAKKVDRTQDGDAIKGSYVDGRSTRSRPSKPTDEDKYPQTSPSQKGSAKERKRDGVDVKSGKTTGDQESTQKWDFSKFESGFSDVVWNATQKLDDAKRKLTNYAGSLRNISAKLAEGDLSLRQDMDNLRRTSNTATELKEGIIAAMRNQFNFMRTALLTHNYELVRVMNSLDVLMAVTSDGFHSALMAHKTALEQITHLNSNLTAVKKMATTELRKRYRRMRGLKKGNNSRACPKEVSAIGSGHSRKMDSQNGAYMVESYTPSVVSSVWVMRGSGRSDQLIEYDTAVDIDYDLVERYFALPFFCQGTGHVVYRRHFYCHLKNSSTVIKYHLKKMDIMSEIVLPGKHFDRYPYKSAENTGVDLAVDERGLWAIYATDESAGKMVISKINHNRMEVEKTWVTKYLKTEVGNAFMICGVLYATNSHTDTPTFVRYTYDTDSATGRILEPGQLPFPNSANLMSTKNPRAQHLANSVMLNYDFRASVLYSWSNSKVEMFPVYFTKLEL